jgi:hypothetical protein
MPKSVAKQSFFDDPIQREDIETLKGGTTITRDIQPGAFISPGRAFGDVPAWTPSDGLQLARWDSKIRSSGNGIQPGAFLSPGRAFGHVPSWTPSDGPQPATWDSTPFEIDCNDSHNVTNSDEAVLDIVAVVVETDELEREVRQRISQEAQIARVETRDGSEITLRRRYIALAGIIVAALITIIGVFAGTIRKPFGDAGDSGQLSEAPPALETVLKDGIVRCGISERLGFGKMNETKGSREGIEVDLVRSIVGVA